MTSITWLHSLGKVIEMDKKEFSMFAMAIRTYYPKENILPNKEAMELWFQELHDIPYDIATVALRKWVSTQKWSPSISEIREMATNVTSGDPMTWGESWEKVLKAIKKYGMYNARDALASLDPLTRKCVESIGFRELCISENPMQDRANFRMIFEIMAKRQQTQQQLALPLQETIKQIQLKGMPLLGDGGAID